MELIPFVCLCWINSVPRIWNMTYYIPLDAEFYGAGFYNIFQIVRISGRTLLSENQHIAAKKNSNFKFQREAIYILLIEYGLCVCVCPRTPPRKMDEYTHIIHGSTRNFTGKVLIYISARSDKLFGSYCRKTGFLMFSGFPKYRHFKGISHVVWKNNNSSENIALLNRDISKKTRVSIAFTRPCFGQNRRTRVM